MSIVVFFVMCVVVLPMYSEIFESNTLELPIYTKILFTLSGFIKENLLFVLLGLFLFILIFLLFIISKKGKKVLINVISKIFGINKIFNVFGIEI